MKSKKFNLIQKLAILRNFPKYIFFRLSLASQKLLRVNKLFIYYKNHKEIRSIKNFFNNI